MDSTPTIPTNFRSIVNDFLRDLTATYPDYSYLWSKWIDEDVTDEDLYSLFEYCTKVYPERFFDILYQNDEMFNEENTTNTYFLPNVSFRHLFNDKGISENTKKTMWKYLQLMLFTIVENIKDKSKFGDTMNLFEGIDEKDLQSKLEETMSGITDFFKNFGGEQDGDVEGATAAEQGEGESNDDANKFQEGFKTMFKNMPNSEEFKKSFPEGMPMPNLENLQEHLRTLFDGKIGKLAKEMAEEIADEFKDFLGDDTQNINNPQDIIKKLMKNPAKMMDLIKKVGGKLDSKMKSGEFSREDIMKEAADLLSKMKGMGKQDEFNEMMKNMAKSMGGLGKNARIDTSILEKITKNAEAKERFSKSSEARKQKKQEDMARELEQLKQRVKEQEQAIYSLSQKGDANNFVFRLEGAETQEKSFIHPDLIAEMNSTETKPKSKSGKKKNKGKK